MKHYKDLATPTRYTHTNKKLSELYIYHIKSTLYGFLKSSQLMLDRDVSSLCVPFQVCSSISN